MADDILWLNCPHCKAKPRLRGSSEALANYAGATIACPTCSKAIVVPGPPPLATLVPRTDPPQFKCAHCAATLTWHVQGQIKVTSSVISCGRCGKNSRIPDGIYDTAKRIVIHIAEAMPSEEREAYIAQIAALQEILKSERARAQTLTDLEATRAAIEEEAPDLAPFLNNYLLSGPQWHALIKVLLVGIAALLAVLVSPIAGAVPNLVKVALDEIEKLQAKKGTKSPESVEPNQTRSNREKRARRARRGK